MNHPKLSVFFLCIFLFVMGLIGFVAYGSRKNAPSNLVEKADGTVRATFNNTQGRPGELDIAAPFYDKPELQPEIHGGHGKHHEGGHGEGEHHDAKGEHGEGHHEGGHEPGAGAGHHEAPAGTPEDSVLKGHEPSPAHVAPAHPGDH